MTRPAPNPSAWPLWIGVLAAGCWGARPPSDDEPAADPNLSPPSAPTDAPRPPGSAALAAVTACPEGHPTQGCFRQIPGGTFLMGAQPTSPRQPGFDAAARPDEGPPREVEVAGLWLQGTEATVAQLSACVAAGACATPAPADASGGAAAAGLSWTEADALCRFLGGRLPSEAEWEHAARAGIGQRFPWGWAADCPGARSGTQPSTAAGRKESFVQRCPAVMRLISHLDPVGRKRAGDAVSLWTDAEADALCGEASRAPDDALAAIAERHAAPALARAGAAPLPACPPYALAPAGTHNDEHPWGLQDLSGNLAEWTSTAAPGGRIVRGGSFVLSEAADARASARAVVPEGARQPDVGVRCARDAAPGG